ncbi:MAG: TIGR00730 family Rossman fold protein [Deltaproteobacteria bacterium]|nr:TIGR00730 family Rossman fold protein [Deltaproteobacteria bacterium]
MKTKPVYRQEQIARLTDGVVESSRTGHAGGEEEVKAHGLSEHFGAASTMEPGKVATHDLSRYLANLTADLDTMMQLLATLPPSVTVFGGARLAEDDPYYKVAVEIGRQLAAAGLAPCTGGGPGAMSAVPEGFLTGLEQIRLGVLKKTPAQPLVGGLSPGANPEDQRTQGFNIILPAEQRLNPRVQISTSLREFPFRKLALYENCRGLVTMPGGYGTLDELFEVWTLAARGKHNDPMVVAGSKFWAPLFAAIEKVAVVDRRLIDETVFAKMRVLDDPQQVVAHLAGATSVRGFEERPEILHRRLRTEIRRALTVVSRLPPAVAMVGGLGTHPDDPEVAAIREVARRATASGVALRIAGPLGVGGAVVAGAQAAKADAAVQGFLLAGFPAPETPGLKIHMRVSDLITEKELLSRNIRGLVAGPGGLGTLGKVFTLLCEIQTGKVPKVPVVLVGKSFWQPIFDAIKNTMLDDHAYAVHGWPRPRHTIAAEDLSLVTITDDPAEVARIIGA